MKTIYPTEARAAILRGESFPSGLVVKGNMNLSGCTSLTALPDGLAVGGDLYLSGCTALTAGLFI